MIRKLFIAAFLILGISIVVAASTAPALFQRNDAPALEVTTSIRPVTKDEYQLLTRPLPGMYRCSARIHDEPGSRRVLGTKDIVIGPGESGEEAAIFGNLRVEFRATIGKALDRADTVVTITRNEKVISRQSSTVWLERQVGIIHP